MLMTSSLPRPIREAIEEAGYEVPQMPEPILLEEDEGHYEELSFVYTNYTRRCYR